MSIVLWIWTAMLVLTIGAFAVLTLMMFGPRGIFRESVENVNLPRIVDDEASEVNEQAAADL